MKKIFIELACAQDSLLDFQLQRSFNGEAYVISNLYNRLLPEVRGRNLEKISIRLTDREGVDYITEPQKLTPFCLIQKTYSFEEFFKIDERSRRKDLLKIMHSCIREACIKFIWDTFPFEEAYRRVIDAGYVNRYLVGKLVMSKDKTHKAGIEVELQPDGVNISVVFFTSDSMFIKKNYLLKVHFILTEKFLGKGKWINNKDFVVSDRAGEIKFKVSLEYDQVELLLTPIKNTHKALIDDIKIASVYSDQAEVMNLIENKIKEITD